MLEIKEVFTLSNLIATHKRCRGNKQHKSEVVVYEMNLFSNLDKLQNQILNRTYYIKRYRKFKIFEPKERVIESLSYNHRLVQNCLCEHVLRPVLENHLIFDNAACRKEKGTDFARNRIKKFIVEYKKHNKGSGYVLKCDISKYFASIRHDKLKEALSKIFPEDIMWLLNIYIDSNGKEVGIPIGNQTSQWFALIYLNKLDRLIKEKFRIKYYTRYMDDFVLIHHSKSFLKSILAQIEIFVADLGLRLNNKTKIQKLNEGVDYLGFVYFVGKNNKIVTEIRHDSNKRIIRTVKKNRFKYLSNIKSFKEYGGILLNYNNYLKRTNYKFRTNFVKTYSLKNIKE